MSTEPLKKYIKALEAHAKGKDSEASQLLAECVGLDKPTAIMRDSIKSLADKENPNLALITLMIKEMEE